MKQIRNFLYAILFLWILFGATFRLAAQNQGAEKVKEPAQARIEPKHRTDPNFVVVCYRGKVIAKLRAAKPFIEEWAFSDDRRHVVVKSRAAHGPAMVELFGLHNGPAEASVAAFDENLPDWARPLGDR